MRLVLPILASRWIWAAVVISSSIVFTTGIMFVRIRNSPWVGQGKQGSWLAGGYQNQYGMEVEVMTGICECRLLSCLIVKLIWCRWYSRILIRCAHFPGATYHISIQTTCRSLYLVHGHLIALLCSLVALQCEEPRYDRFIISLLS